MVSQGAKPALVKNKKGLGVSCAVLTTQRTPQRERENTREKRETRDEAARTKQTPHTHTHKLLEREREREKERERERERALSPVRRGDQEIEINRQGLPLLSGRFMAASHNAERVLRWLLSEKMGDVEQAAPDGSTALSVVSLSLSFPPYDSLFSLPSGSPVLFSFLPC